MTPPGPCSHSDTPVHLWKEYIHSDFKRNDYTKWERMCDLGQGLIRAYGDGLPRFRDLSEEGEIQTVT
jgi:hypothetical protein